MLAMPRGIAVLCVLPGTDFDKLIFQRTSDSGHKRRAEDDVTSLHGAGVCLSVRCQYSAIAYAVEVMKHRRGFDQAMPISVSAPNLTIRRPRQTGAVDIGP